MLETGNCVNSFQRSLADCAKPSGVSIARPIRGRVANFANFVSASDNSWDIDRDLRLPGGLEIGVFQLLLGE